MEITQVQVGNFIYPLVEGQPLPIAVGEKLKVFYAFNYKMLTTTSVPIWASLYRYTLGILDRSSNAQTKTTISLEESLEWKPYEGQIDIVVGSVDAGLWGLIVEILGYEDAEAKIDNCIEVSAAPGIFDMLKDILPLIMIMMVFMMITPMMQGLSEGEEA